MGEKERVCVTGAGGFQGSWLVKLLLSQGYMVHGTVRDPGDEKNSHLKNLDKAKENLHLFKADLLDFDSLCAAIAGCTGVFHVASPVPTGSVCDPEAELIQPALTGTSNVLKACCTVKVRRLVVVSSIAAAAVTLNPNWPKGRAMDESCWSDLEYIKVQKLWDSAYCSGKTEAEALATKVASEGGLDVVTVCPSIMLGPMLQSTLNNSSSWLLQVLNGGFEAMEDTLWMIVDVRDVAEALLLVYKKPEAEGRYICSSWQTTAKGLVEKLKSIFPDRSYPKQFTGESADWILSSEKLQNMGWKYRPLEETLVDSFKSYCEKGPLITDDV
ncbi:hypothetical protein Scep_000045 [Stephania cephalantha]|uniref:NAD-dependent epimerase/dehydratase domain-containing protein n=1 Tax=Stephania cephalantha TaxID=152367 RepID=A0AAP0L912_9MAGN